MNSFGLILNLQKCSKPLLFFLPIAVSLSKNLSLMNNFSKWNCCTLGRYEDSLNYSRYNDKCSFYRNTKCIFHFYHQNQDSGFCSNKNFNLLEVSLITDIFSKCWMSFLKNLPALMPLQILFIECISCIDIYNMHICLLMIKNIAKLTMH